MARKVAMMTLPFVVMVASVAGDQTVGGDRLVADHKYMRPPAQPGQLSVSWFVEASEMVSIGEATETIAVFVAKVRPSDTTRVGV